jgi:DNA replication protein DnaC
MLDKATLNKLHEPHLSGTAAAFVRQQEEKDIDTVSFNDRFTLPVEAGRLEKKNRRIGRLMKEAAFRFPAAIENIDFQGKHGMTKADAVRLAEGSRLRQKQNLIIPGPAGVGKTYTVSAPGRHACVRGIAVRYFRVPDLFLKISDARTENRYAAFRKKIAAVPFLMLDGWGLRKFSLEETREPLELFEQRHDRTPTPICGQLPHTAWHELFPDPALADAVLDRVIHNALKYAVTGESMGKVPAERSAAEKQGAPQAHSRLRGMGRQRLPHTCKFCKYGGFYFLERQPFKCCRIFVQIKSDLLFKYAGFCTCLVLCLYCPLFQRYRTNPILKGFPGISRFL